MAGVGTFDAMTERAGIKKPEGRACASPPSRSQPFRKAFFLLRVNSATALLLGLFAHDAMGMPIDTIRIDALGGRNVRLFSRNGHNFADRFPRIAEAIEALPVRSWFTCGHYAIEANGRTNGLETVIVSGGGNIGLCAAAAARGMGARVILVDPLPLRRAAPLRKLASM